MKQAETLFDELMAGDVMSRTVVVLSRGMSVVAAARLLLDRQLSMAPVIDAKGRCVGVLSATDLLKWAANSVRTGGPAPTEGVWCDWQVVSVESTRRDEVCRHMTANPLLVTPDTPLAEIADVLLDPRCRSIVVVDEGQRPLGVITSNGILAALACEDCRFEVNLPVATSSDSRVPTRRTAHVLGSA